MKNFILSIICLSLSSIIFSQNTATSVQDGNWLNPLTWSCTCVPTPGYRVEILHNVTLDTDFAYSEEFIIIHSTGSLIQNNSNRNLWVYDTGYLTNHGNILVDNIQYDGEDGSLINTNIITAKNIYVTTGINNSGTINADSLFNTGTIDNAGLIDLLSITSSDIFGNSGVLYFNNFTNTGYIHNSAGLISGTNSLWNHGVIINYETSSLVVENDLLNSNLVSYDALIINNGTINVNGNFHNFDTIAGITGYLEIADTSYNAGYIKGSFDICDLTPPQNSPYIDVNLGFVSPDITWCEQQSVVESSYSSFLMYPNPTSDILIVEIPNPSEIINISIIDIYGRLLYNNSTKIENINQLDLNNYTKGLYICVIENKYNNKQQKRFVKN